MSYGAKEAFSLQEPANYIVFFSYILLIVYTSIVPFYTCLYKYQGSHRNLIMNFHDFSMTICHFSMTFDHQLNSFATTPF